MTIPEISADLFECRENGTFRIRSSTSGKKYWIKVTSEGVFCDCPDARMRRNGKTDVCKHIWGTEQEPGVLRLIGLTVILQLQKQDKEHEKHTSTNNRRDPILPGRAVDSPFDEESVPF